MLRNYFIIAFRYIIRNKVQSFIQVLSLAIGITAIILIGIYVVSELSFDKFNEKKDRIYRLEYGDYVGKSSAIGHQIKENLPEVENVVRIRICGKRPVKYISDQGKASEREIDLVLRSYYCDSTVFDVFTFPFIQGDPKTALKDPFSVVLTESTARALFGNKDPVGEIIDIELPEPQNRSFTVTGVIQDVENFHIYFDILVSMVSLREQHEDILNSYWTSWIYFTYLLLEDDFTEERVENNINAFFKDVKDLEMGRYSKELAFSMRPLKEIYFSSRLKRENGYCVHGNLKLLRVLITIVVFILVLACINYINLATARASLRAREVGVRKVLGSLKSRLIAQFLVESVLMGLVSFLIAIILVQVLLPIFNQMVRNELSMEILFHPQIILISFACVLLLGIIAGIYPAVYLTTFQPVASLKGEQLTGVKSILFRRILLTFQFAISVVLMIGVSTILRQLRYMKTADLGCELELVLGINALDMRQDYVKRQVFREKMLSNPNIKKVAFGLWPGGKGTEGLIVEYNGIKIHPYRVTVDPDYFDLFGIEVVQGRNFSWDMPGDYDTRYSNQQQVRIIVNETFVRELDLESPVGTIIGTEDERYNCVIIGVVEDFHHLSLHHKIDPNFYIWRNFLNRVSLKISPNNIQGTINSVGNEFESMYPKHTFGYQFLDERFDTLYKHDVRLFKIISNFAIVAILIACLGLFGLSSFMAARRTKEIGIRKVMGASVRTVFLLLSREFVKWVALSVIIACPAAWIIMNRWLQSFTYRTNINWWIFALVILMAFAITFMTVAWQSLKTARTNPVEALRYE